MPLTPHQIDLLQSTHAALIALAYHHVHLPHRQAQALLLDSAGFRQASAAETLRVRVATIQNAIYVARRRVALRRLHPKNAARVWAFLHGPCCLYSAVRRTEREAPEYRLFREELAAGHLPELSNIDALRSSVRSGSRQKSETRSVCPPARFAIESKHSLE